jgi:hypothetical protein
MMQPLGRKKITFPSKTKEWFGKGILMWWEDRLCIKKSARQDVKKQIKHELDNP